MSNLLSISEYICISQGIDISTVEYITQYILQCFYTFTYYNRVTHTYCKLYSVLRVLVKLYIYIYIYCVISIAIGLSITMARTCTLINEETCPKGQFRLLQVRFRACDCIMYCNSSKYWTSEYPTCRTTCYAYVCTCVSFPNQQLLGA